MCYIVLLAFPLPLPAIRVLLLPLALALTSDQYAGLASTQERKAHRMGCRKADRAVLLLRLHKEIPVAPLQLLLGVPVHSAIGRS